MTDIEAVPTDDGIRFSVNGGVLADYVARPTDARAESPRPYLAPVRTLAGDVVTDVRPADHPWHKGVSWALPVVGDENFWGGPSYVDGQGYVSLPNNGTQRHLGFDRIDGGARAEAVERLQWETQSGEVVFDETRRLTVGLLGPDAWMLLFETTMTSRLDTAVGLGSPTTKGRPNAGYGGLFWRGPSTFTGGRLLAPRHDGDDPNGDDPDGDDPGADLQGIRSDWLGYVGGHPNGNRSTVVMVDLPGNPRHPVQWFSRSSDYAGLCPAPFFSEEWVVAAGGAFHARYAVVIADAERDSDDAAVLARAAREFAATTTRES